MQYLELLLLFTCVVGVTMSIVNNVTIDAEGVEHSAHQGASTTTFNEELDVSVSGYVNQKAITLATASVVTIYDDDSDFPADWDYLFVKTSQDGYIQLIGSAGNVVLPLVANQPFVLSNKTLLPAADTTKITGGTEPTMETLDSIVIGNYSGASMTIHFMVVD